ncbi:perakine reductase [Quercus suber]|uniref:Perakine reductase n=1 Tax=Quercus suber TaxID=58331 RepID=A0AAW0LDG1_QUESU
MAEEQKVQIPMVKLGTHGFEVPSLLGTTKIKNLDANIGSFRVKLTKEDLKEISDVITINEVAGHRTIDVFIHCSWKFANTPEKEKYQSET